MKNRRAVAVRNKTTKQPLVISQARLVEYYTSKLELQRLQVVVEHLGDLLEIDLTNGATVEPGRYSARTFVGPTLVVD